jgi:hypothetical protein
MRSGAGGTTGGAKTAALNRMNKRYKNRVDIAMKLNEKAKALKFGIQKLKVQIVKTN